MKVVGLIAEYNPFHNGHQYHIEQALKLTNADAALVVMSGNYVQRGAPALMPKHLRAESALKCGASAVFELPVCYASGSAEYFALGAVSLLEQLGCVDSICFGAETADIDALHAIAEILINEPYSYRRILQDSLKSGLSFPSARQHALSEYLGDSVLASYVEQPNNILGIEYLKALHRLQSNIKPYALKRTGAGYHDLHTGSAFSSASAIRNVLANTEVFDPALLEPLLPAKVRQIIFSHWETRFPIYSNDFSLLLKYKLLSMQPKDLIQYSDVTEDLANRIQKQKNQFLSFKQFCELLKTKQFTYTRISRALLHILLDIKKEDMEQYISNYYHGYARLLGFRTDQSTLLTLAKKTSSIPILTKLTATEQIPEAFLSMLEHDIWASNLYESVITDKYQTAFQNEYEQQIVRI